MKIYTKTGDRGQTSLFGGTKVSKASARIVAYGTVDELNCAIGFCRALGVPAGVDAFLKRIQNDLFRLGAELASGEGAPPPTAPPVGEAEVAELERMIDGMEAELPPLKNFILPGGTPAGAAAHLARAVCRRAERLVVELSEKEKVRSEVVVYLNRLSDALFVASRRINALSGASETIWKP